ncbi:hypothetical protein D9V29_06365 [Mycetocola manganoxydans]|uniref:Uncharacterized protein n=1 Tax=Mycetocola manganoxydans TaxID=699879 RepID=A0A3L6ZWI7_9MICO|nr:DUF6350 family protein [Mycetocola manganoxydans]RLP72055.1 hypothetical protein D9V29_06365 [Mycetocola manganoxydans]GHD47728.1 hypothetical protein GCM10008097_19030 [Mycetocola manganoxydans]
MNRTTVAMLAALEALITVAIGIGISLVPLTILWAVEAGFSLDWTLFWQGAVDIWLLSNGVDLSVTLPAEVVAATGLAAASDPFPVTIAPLVLTGFTVIMGARAGIRAAATRYWQTAVLSGLVTVLVLNALAAFSAQGELLRPSLPQALLLPLLVYGFGLAIGVVRGMHRIPVGREGAAGRFLAGIQDRLDERFDRTDRAVAAAALRGGVAAVTGIVGVSAVLFAVLILANFGVVTSLYQGSQLGGIGGAATTLAQLAFIPNLVLWAASWLVGPGFALGAGSAISPVNTVVGPVPGLPILGAIPSGDFAFGFVGLLVPVLIGFFAASLVRPRLVAALAGRPLVARLLIAAAGIGLVAGVILGLLAWFSGGAIGPGRLAVVGPNPVLVGAFCAIEVAIAAAIGMASGNTRREAAPAASPLRTAERVR